MTDDDRQRPRSVVPYVVVIGAGMVLLIAGLIVSIRNGGDTRTGRGVPRSTVPAPAESSPLPPVVGPVAPGRTPLPGFGEVAISVEADDGEMEEFCALAARSAAQRERGLMTVTDITLGGYDAMVFEFSSDVDGGFWMRNTPMPLTIAYIDASGRLVSSVDMEPCRDSPDCPPFPSDGKFRWAVEAPRARFGALGIGPDSTVRVGGRCSAAT